MRSKPTAITALAKGGLMAVAGLALCATSAQALTVKELSQLTGAERTKILLDGAKKEGKAVLYTPINVNNTLRPIKADFEKKYPGVLFEYWRGSGNKTHAKVTAEAQAKSRTADLIEGGSGAIQMIKGNLVQAFTSPSLNAYGKEYYDPNGLWAPSRVAYMGSAYNTKQVKAKDLPKVFEDVLDPKWKGKMVWAASTDTAAPLFISNLLKTRGEKKTEAFLAKLKTQNIVSFSGPLSNMTDRVGQGEYAMSLHSPAHTALSYTAKGAPMDVAMMEPVPGIVNTIQLIRDAPHPHAALLFLDYYLSEQGQGMLGKTGYIPLHPKTKPKVSLQKAVPRLTGQKEYVVTPEIMFATSGKPRALFNKYFR